MSGRGAGNAGSSGGSSIFDAIVEGANVPLEKSILHPRAAHEGKVLKRALSELREPARAPDLAPRVLRRLENAGLVSPRRRADHAPWIAAAAGVALGVALSTLMSSLQTRDAGVIAARSAGPSSDARVPQGLAPREPAPRLTQLASPARATLSLGDTSRYASPAKGPALAATLPTIPTSAGATASIPLIELAPARPAAPFAAGDTIPNARRSRPVAGFWPLWWTLRPDQEPSDPGAHAERRDP